MDRHSCTTCAAINAQYPGTINWNCAALIYILRRCCNENVNNKWCLTTGVKPFSTPNRFELFIEQCSILLYNILNFVTYVLVDSDKRVCLKHSQTLVICLQPFSELCRLLLYYWKIQIFPRKHCFYSTYIATYEIWWFG